MVSKKIFLISSVLVWTLIGMGGCASSSTIAPPVANPWGEAVSPARTVGREEGKAQSIGSHSAGCLLGGAALTPDGPGFQLMRITRRRFYAHPALVQYVKKLGREVSKAGAGPLLIGDASQPRGGPFVSGHRSHQTGLDVDIWFMQPPEAKVRSLTLDERESWGARSLLGLPSLELATVRTLKLAASMEEVDRIFVNARIKKQLCTSLRPAEREWLRKIRPWWGHDAHFHVRLRCPADSPLCRSGSDDALPPGDGCDPTLEWWFTDEARQEAGPSGPFKLPELPVECQQVLLRRDSSG